MPDIAIGLVDIMLLELLADHLALHVQAFFAESKAEHAVALQPKSRLQVFGRKLTVIVGKVIGGIGIVLSTGNLQRVIIVRNVD